MTTINIENILEENKKIGVLINEVGEILLRHDIKIYQTIVAKFDFTHKLTVEEETKFLQELYHHMTDQLKELINK